MGFATRLKKLLFATLRNQKYVWLSDCKNVTNRPEMLCYQPLLTRGVGKITFGPNVQIGVVASPNFYSHYCYLEARNPQSEIIIESGTAINNGFSAVATVKIHIGRDVLIGVNCSILDSDAHELAPNKRQTGTPSSAPVIISNNVFLGSSVTILKGVTIGENSVIGNGSVVVKDIPANVVAAGNPARIIRNL